MTDGRNGCDDGGQGQQSQHNNSASEQLRELFHRFDRQNKGYLTLEDLELVCSSTMGMEKDEVPAMFAQLDQDQDGRVTFSDFSDHWQNVTQQSSRDDQQVEDDTADGRLCTTSPPRLLLSPDSDEDDGTEVEPKYVLNEKRFGRRSRPEIDTKQENSVKSNNKSLSHHHQQQEHGSPDLASQMGSIRSSSLLARFGLADTCHTSPLIQRRTFSFGCGTDGSPTQSRTVIKSSSAIVADSEDSVFDGVDKDESVSWDPNSHYTLSSQSPTGDEMNMIKAVFDKYDVNDDGLINKQDLSDVCDSLGMSQTEEQLSELFDMLDEDGDGQVSLDDFCKKLTVVKETYELESPTFAPHSSLFEVATSTPVTGQAHSRVATPALIGTNLLAKKSAVVEDLFHRLDRNNKGVVQRDALISMWMDQSGDPHNEQHQQITRFLQGLETDENGYVSVEEVTFGMQAALMDDQNRDIRDPALRIYLTGIRHLRSRLVTVELEHEKLQADFLALSEEKARLVRIGDEEADQLRREHKQDRESDELKFQEKTQQLERDHRYEQEMVEQQAQKQIKQLEEEIENMKLADDIMKLKIRDLEEDKQLLEKELQSHVDETEEKDRFIEQLQRELDEENAAHSTNDGQGILDDYDHNDTKEELTEQVSKLTKENAELRDTIDERIAEIGLYKQQLLHERRKAQRDGRRRRPSGGSTSTIRRAGSKVGDYMKKRKETASGSTSADDTDGSRPKSRDDGVVVSPTPPPGAERSSADGDSSEDEVILCHQADDDDDDDDDLIPKYVARIKELESEKSHVEASFQEKLDQKTADLQQENKQLTVEKEDLIVRNNKLSSQLLSLQSMAEASDTANSELQTIVMERQELSIKAQHLEVKLANAQEANEGLRQQNDELKAKRQELLADSNQFLLDIGKLEKENHQLKLQHNADMKEMQERLTKQWETTVSKLQEEAENLQSDISSLRKEHDDELQVQKEQFVHENEEMRHRVTEECQLQLEKLQAVVEEMRAGEEGLKFKVTSLYEENHQLKHQHNTDMTETQDKLRERCHEVDQLQTDVQRLKAENEETLQKQKELELTLDKQRAESAEIKRQVLEECKEQTSELQKTFQEMASENSNLHRQIENANTAREQQAQMLVTLAEMESHQDSLVKDQQHLKKQLNDVQEELARIAEEKDHWKVQADTLERTILERDKTISELEETSFVREDIDKEITQLHDENAKLKKDLRDQCSYASSLATVLGKYSAESTEQRLIEEAELKQRLEQLEEENKSLHRQITPLKKQTLYRFTSPKAERNIEALRLENSALARAMTASHENEKQLKIKCQELNDQKEVLLKLLHQVALSSIH